MLGELISPLSTWCLPSGLRLLIHAIQPLDYAEPELFALSLGEATDKNLMAMMSLLENEWRRRTELLGEQSSWIRKGTTWVG